jgi:L-xylulokinase
MADYLLGIDNGSTVSKAAIFDLQGKEVAVASRTVEIDYPKPGWTERDMDAIWSSTAEAIKEAITRSGVKPSQILGVGTTGHGNGVYLLDKKGRRLRPGIASLDTRAGQIVDDWNRSGLHPKVFPYTLQAFWPAQPNALLAWFKQNEPATYEKIGTVFLIKDYIKYCLSGDITTDFTDMMGTSLMDVKQRAYSQELLEMYGIPEIRQALPVAAESFELVGRITAGAAQVTGLKEGTPIVGGVYDIDGSSLGAGIIDPGQVCIIAGTWSINSIVTSEPLVDPRILMTRGYTVPGLWISIEASATSTTNLEWFVRNFCHKEQLEARERGMSVYEICNELVESIPPDEIQLFFHPFLFGSNVQANARAGFYGLAGWQTKSHLLKALYEGVVFGHLSHINVLRAAGAQMEVVRLTGGGSRSKVWTQIFADVTQLPMEVPDGTEAGARGAAINAGIGVGVYKDHREAVRQAVQVVRRQEPDAQLSERYQRAYGEYRSLVEAMHDHWDLFSALGQSH